LLLTRKLLKLGFLLVRLKSWLRKFYGRHHDHIIWEIYTPYAGDAGMLLHINGKFTMGKLKLTLLS
jgi:hypothetical protein